jgi:hypothetical protein
MVDVNPNDLILQQFTLFRSEFRDQLKRIEDKIDAEVADLKNEQIADLKEGNRRLADDQRRLWDTVGKLQEHKATQHGGKNAVTEIRTVIIALLASTLAVVVGHFIH